MIIGIRRLVEDYIQHYNAKDVESMLKLFTEDTIFESVSSASGIIRTEGKDKLRQIALKTLEIFEERRQTPTTMILGDNVAAVEIEYWCRLAMDLPDGKKAGDEMHLRGASFFVLKDGLIGKLTDYM
jgi:ketosteroid isomerase-like protein